MYINSITPAGITSSVWSAATRKLTDNGVQAFSTDVNDGTLTTGVVQGTFGAYVQFRASLTHSVRWINLIIDNASGARVGQVALAIGGAGSEVDQMSVIAFCDVLGNETGFYMQLNEAIFPKNARFSMRAANLSSAAADNWHVTAVWGYAND